MSDIVLSAGVRQNLLALQNTAKLMSTTQNRLATGKKVNSALDNPVNFFTASGLQTRAADLSALLDAMSNGVKTLQAADNGLTSITTTLQSMQSTMLQARQDKSFKVASYTLDSRGDRDGAGEELDVLGRRGAGSVDPGQYRALQAAAPATTTPDGAARPLGRSRHDCRRRLAPSDGIGRRRRSGRHHRSPRPTIPAAARRLTPAPRPLAGINAGLTTAPRTAACAIA